MKKYDCKNCINSKTGSVFKRNKKCESCLVDIKNHTIIGKPSNYKEIKGEQNNDDN